MKAIRLTGELLDKIMNNANEQEREAFIKQISNHLSDSVRCWAAFMNRKTNNYLEEKLAYIYPFAADHHFGVREISWMSIRDDLSQHLDVDLV